METQVDAALIERFRDYLVRTIKSDIGAYLPELEDPFFLIAATGLGKTVVVPVHRLAQALRAHPTGHPRIVVVEPKIAIAKSQAKKMNEFWADFCKAEAVSDHRPLFGCRTKADKTPTDAPIVFLTTGLFGIFARKDKFRPGVDSVLMDEAHSTVEAGHEVELGVVYSRARGVRVDFMSATVDEACIAEAFPDVRIVKALPKRHAVWIHPTGQPLLDCVVDVVRGTILDFKLHGKYTAKDWFQNGKGVNEALLEKGRAKGALVIVASCSSEKSDAQQVLRLLRRAFSKDEVEIGLLTGQTLRDPRQSAEYEAMLARWKRDKKRYVLVATSVVEMGVTLPDLDVVITEDETIEEDEETGAVGRVPLGVNDFVQRIGRVGRERPGLAVIAQIAGTAYATAEVNRLNVIDYRAELLKPDAIRWPMERGDMTMLAWHVLSLDPKQRAELKMHFPSRQKSRDWTEWLYKAASELKQNGFSTPDARLTDLGRSMERWVGRYDLAEAASFVRLISYKRDSRGIRRLALAKAVDVALRSTGIPTDRQEIRLLLPLLFEDQIVLAEQSKNRNRKRDLAIHHASARLGLSISDVNRALHTIRDLYEIASKSSVVQSIAA